MGVGTEVLAIQDWMRMRGGEGDGRGLFLRGGGEPSVSGDGPGAAADEEDEG